mmetsp:Transcript_61683/g.133628  ORF Transcript_61683/g.133628 Transcript_61683/m.133628 type:complete len:791 (+) Transcript_61683:634-3006(+)
MAFGQARCSDTHRTRPAQRRQVGRRVDLIILDDESLQLLLLLGSLLLARACHLCELGILRDLDLPHEHLSTTPLLQEAEDPWFVSFFSLFGRRRRRKFCKNPWCHLLALQGVYEELLDLPIELVGLFIWPAPLFASVVVTPIVFLRLRGLAFLLGLLLLVRRVTLAARATLVVLRAVVLVGILFLLLLLIEVQVFALFLEKLDERAVHLSPRLRNVHLWPQPLHGVAHHVGDAQGQLTLEEDVPAEELKEAIQLMLHRSPVEVVPAGLQQDADQLDSKVIPGRLHRMLRVRKQRGKGCRILSSSLLGNAAKSSLSDSLHPLQDLVHRGHVAGSVHGGPSEPYEVVHHVKDEVRVHEPVVVELPQQFHLADPQWRLPEVVALDRHLDVLEEAVNAVDDEGVAVPGQATKQRSEQVQALVVGVHVQLQNALLEPLWGLAVPGQLTDKSENLLLIFIVVEALVHQVPREELQGILRTCLLALALGRLYLVVGVLQHDLQSQGKRLDVLQPHHPFQQVLCTHCCFRRVQEKAPAALQDMSDKLGMVLREVVAQRLEGVKHHSWRANLELAELAEVADSFHLGLDGSRILLNEELLKLLLEGRHHSGGDILEIGGHDGDEARVKLERVQRGPLVTAEVDRKCPPRPLRVVVVEELLHEVVDLLCSLGLHYSHEVELEVGGTDRGGLVVLAASWRFFILLDHLWLLLLDLVRLAFPSHEGRLVTLVTLVDAQEDCGDDLSGIQNLLVEALLLGVFPEHGQLIARLLRLFLLLLTASQADCACLLLLGHWQGLVQRL